MEHAQPANLVHPLGALVLVAHPHRNRPLRAVIRRSALLRVMGYVPTSGLLIRLLPLRLLRHLRERLRAPRVGGVCAPRHRARLVLVPHVRATIGRLHVPRARHGVQLGVFARAQTPLLLHVRQAIAALSSQLRVQCHHVCALSVRRARLYLLRRLQRWTPSTLGLHRRPCHSRFPYGHY